MPFLKAEVLHEEATRLGIDISEMTWQEAQKVVQAAIAEDKAKEHVKNEEKKIEVPKPNPKPKNDKINFNETILSFEIKPIKHQLIKYDEELGDEYEVEEVVHDIEGVKSLARDLNTGTYRVKGKTGRKVIAQSTLPQEQAAITFDAQKDMFPVVTFQGRRGYLFKHHKYFNVESTLKDSGYFEKYKRFFDAGQYPTNIWYSTGLLVCSIPLVHHIMKEIEQDAANDKR